MKEQLAFLEEHLIKSRPQFYAQLNPPLNENEISALESKYAIKLPDDIIVLYSWKNGQKASCYESFVNNSTFMPLEEALSASVLLTSMINSDFDIKNWWHKDWVPLFHNGGGDHICYDSGGTFTGQKGQLIEFWHADNDRNVIAPTLLDFIKQLNAYYLSTPKNKFDSYFGIEDIKGFPKKFIVE